MEFTGERVVPGDVERQELFAEHMRRYVFAGDIIPRGGRVLDAGCGAGYGSAHLAATSARVTGIDLAGDAIAFARSRFPRDNVDFRVMDVARLQFPDASFDAVVSFEVIEHVDAGTQGCFVREVGRVLAPGGLFVVSTPNRALYRAIHGSNAFHLAELSPHEFESLLRDVFPSVDLYGERKTRAYLSYELMLDIEARLAQVQANQARVSYLLDHPRSLLGLAIKSIAGERTFRAARSLVALTSTGARCRRAASRGNGERGVAQRTGDGVGDTPQAILRKLARAGIDDFEISPHDVDTALYIVAVCRKYD